MANKYYVYRFLNSDYKVVYIGRTDNIKRRMREHFKYNTLLSEEAYREVVRVDYIELKTKIDMNIKEMYYIGKIHPKYNKTYNDHEVTIELDEFQDSWVSYDFDNNVVKAYKQEILNIKAELNAVNKIINSLISSEEVYSYNEAIKFIEKGVIDTMYSAKNSLYKDKMYKNQEDIIHERYPESEKTWRKIIVSSPDRSRELCYIENGDLTRLSASSAYILKFEIWETEN